MKLNRKNKYYLLNKDFSWLPLRKSVIIIFEEIENPNIDYESQVFLFNIINNLSIYNMWFKYETCKKISIKTDLLLSNLVGLLIKYSFGF